MITLLIPFLFLFRETFACGPPATGLFRGFFRCSMSLLIILLLLLLFRLPGWDYKCRCDTGHLLPFIFIGLQNSGNKKTFKINGVFTHVPLSLRIQASTTRPYFNIASRLSFRTICSTIHSRHTHFLSLYLFLPGFTLIFL